MFYEIICFVFKETADNKAYNKPTNQSSTRTHHVPSRAVDGDYGTHSSDCTWTLTGPNEWYKIMLEKQLYFICIKFNIANCIHKTMVYTVDDTYSKTYECEEF